MSTILVATDDEVYSLDGAELRFREACQFYVLFKRHHGPQAGQADSRFLWVCYVDAFLMCIVSLKDLTAKKTTLNACDLFRLMVVMRNLTAHKAVVSSQSPMLMINRDIAVSTTNAGYEEPVLFAPRIATALTHYEAELRKETMGNKTRWDFEKGNVRGAARWNATLAAQTTPRVKLSEVFLDALKFVGGAWGFTLPSIP